MIVTRNRFNNVLKLFEKGGLYGLDTETTGIENSDRLFSIILADCRGGYYFHFEKSTPGSTHENTFPKSWLAKFQRVFDNPRATWAIHNAKFDLAMLAKEKLHIRGKVHCTQITARIIKNNLLNYSLKNCVKPLGLAKDESVEAYIKEHGLYESYDVPGKKLRKTRKFFWQVPLDIMAGYGANDAVLHRELAKHQLEALKETRPGEPGLGAVYENEHKLLPVCVDMEKVGIKINRPYVEAGLAHEQAEYEKLTREFEKLTGTPFRDSNKALAEVFTKLGFEYPKTEKGNPTFTKDVLDKIDHPLADLVRRIRRRAMFVGTYYSSFLYYADEEGVIHPSMRQDATATGRFSYHEPNMQNVPKEEETEGLKFLVRSSFIPREGFCFVAIDYRQQEFKMLLDYAKEKEVIAEILAGKDVHQATADQMGIPRSRAKTIGFGCLYGMGVGKLARSLKVPEAEARDLRNTFFSKLPGVEYFTKAVQNSGATRRYVFNWLGRRCYIDHPDYAYKLLNHLIQGGCADVVKVAMIRLHDFLIGCKSRMVCQVHDEILFEIHESELDIVPELAEIMENVYKPRSGLPLTVSVEYSWKSWGKVDMVEGNPCKPKPLLNCA